MQQRISAGNVTREQHSPIYDDPARRGIVRVQLIQPLMTQKHLPKEFELHVSTNDLRKAVADAGSVLYEWLDGTSTNADDEDEESDFELFARDVLDALGRHPAELSYDEESELAEDDMSASEFE